MRYSHDMVALQSSPRYIAAKRVLEDILKRREPDAQKLKFLYGSDIASRVRQSVMKFYEDPSFDSGRLREHDTNAPTILSDMRAYVDKDPDFSAMDVYFSPQIRRTEDIDNLVKEIESNVGANIKNKFGEYSSHVIRAAALAMHHQLKRKCNISVICHWTGTAGSMYYLQSTRNIPINKDIHFGTTVAFLHDFKEEFPRVVLHKDGTPYGLYRSDEFVHDYLQGDEDLVNNISVLANLYGEIPKYAYYTLKKQGITFTQERFREFLEKYMFDDHDIDHSMEQIHENIHKLLLDKDYGTLIGRDFLNAVAWDSYSYYVNRIWNKSIKLKNDTPINVKFTDQNYNFIGKDILSNEDLTKNLLKLWMWSSEVYSSAINLPHTNNFVRELLEDTLCYSEFYVIKNFAKQEAILPFYASAFQKIKTLSPIFYTHQRIH
jgi:hypothetical protein